MKHTFECEFMEAFKPNYDFRVRVVHKNERGIVVEIVERDCHLRSGHLAAAADLIYDMFGSVPDEEDI